MHAFHIYYSFAADKYYRIIIAFRLNNSFCSKLFSIKSHSYVLPFFLFLACCTLVSYSAGYQSDTEFKKKFDKWYIVRTTLKFHSVARITIVKPKQ